MRGLKRDIGQDIGRAVESHPTRVRGLKPNNLTVGGDLDLVAPHAGAWIETRPVPERNHEPCGRTPRGCVD